MTEISSPQPLSQPFGRYLHTAFRSLSRPLLALRLRYVPLLVVYFAYGALGLIDVSRDMWVKEQLTLTPAELAGIAVWLSLPWTVKDGFRRTRRQPANPRLATAYLHHHRRAVHRVRHARASGQRRWMADLR